MVRTFRYLEPLPLSCHLNPFTLPSACDEPEDAKAVLATRGGSRDGDVRSEGLKVPGDRSEKGERGKENVDLQ